MLKSLLWIGATGIALVAGIAYHHGDDIERAGHEIEASLAPLERMGDELDKEFAAAEEEIEAGADREASYEDAMASALVSSGILTADNIEELVRTDDKRELVVNDGVQIQIGDVLGLARAKIAEGRESGDVPEESGVSASNIQAVLDILEDMDGFNADIQTIEVEP